MILRKKDKQSLKQIFSNIPLPVEVWAYGSRVTGSAHEGSDLDLVIRSHDLKPLPYDSLLEIIDKIKDSNIPILVELRDWARIPAYFHKYIEQHYEVLFDNKAAFSFPSTSAH